MTKSTNLRRQRRLFRKNHPDPLKGAVKIFAHESATKKAAEIVAGHNAGPWGRDLQVTVTDVLEDGAIVGLDRKDRVCFKVRI